MYHGFTCLPLQVITLQKYEEKIVPRRVFSKEVMETEINNGPIHGLVERKKVIGRLCSYIIDIKNENDLKQALYAEFQNENVMINALSKNSAKQLIY